MINPKLCPFCKNENFCEVDSSNNSCWCNNIKVPVELREFVPDIYKMKTCICKKCILHFKENSEEFIKKYKLTK